MTTARVAGPKHSPDEAFGRTVHMVMFDKRITQMRLAAETGIEQSLLSKKLRGLRPWTLREMISVADALHIDARDLLGAMWTDPGSPASATYDATTDAAGSNNRCYYSDGVIIGPWDGSIPQPTSYAA